jgi:hypothetical protein
MGEGHGAVAVPDCTKLNFEQAQALVCRFLRMTSGPFAQARTLATALRGDQPVESLDLGVEQNEIALMVDAVLAG